MEDQQRNTVVYWVAEFSVDFGVILTWTVPKNLKCSSPRSILKPNDTIYLPPHHSGH